ncbi:MAG: hypothetical protein RLQ73_00085 [Hoeflea sp. D1-CHI-28]
MEREVYYYQFYTPHGTVSILPEPAGRWKVMFNEEHLGSYHSPEAAADDVSGGHTFEPSGDADLSELGIPDNLGEWTKKLFASISRLRPA